MIKDMIEASKKAPNWRSVQWPDQTYSKNPRFMQSYEILKKVHDRIYAKKYRKSLDPERKKYLEWKCVAMTNFGSKASWKSSATAKYENDSLKLSDNSKWKNICSDGNYRNIKSFFFFIIYIYINNSNK